MNHLAHLLLAHRAQTCLVGAIIADRLRPGDPVLQHLSPETLAAIAHHRQIDAATDSHPAYQTWVGATKGVLRHHAGVAADIAFDHHLAKHWSEYEKSISLRDFCDICHRALAAARFLPPGWYTQLQRFESEKILIGYATEVGLRIALVRVARRARRSFPLEKALHAIVTTPVTQMSELLGFLGQVPVPRQKGNKD